MRVYFLRHAEAGEADSDFDRRLTAKGIAQSEKVGEFCRRHDLIPDVVLTSPVVRARETAEIVAARLDSPEVIAERWIACGMSPERFLAEIGAYSKFGSVMLSGHEPDFSETIAVLVGLSSNASIHVRKGSLTAIDLPTVKAGGGKIEFSVPVRLM